MESAKYAVMWGKRESDRCITEYSVYLGAKKHQKCPQLVRWRIAIQSLKGENEEFEINVVKICQRHSQPSQQLISTAYGIINNSNPRMKQPHDIFNSVEVSCIGN